MYGPKGTGAVIARDDLRWSGEIHSGTPNTPGIAGFGEACRLRRLEMDDDGRRVAGQRDRLQELLTSSLAKAVVNGDLTNRLPGNLHMSIPGVPNDAVTARLRDRVAISTGAACTSGAQTPSHVLRAMGMPDALQEGALRIGLSKFTTNGEVELASRLIASAVTDIESLMVA